MEEEKRKQLLDRLKKSNQIYEQDDDTLESELELELENELKEKKDTLISLLLEKQILLFKANSLT